MSDYRRGAFLGVKYNTTGSTFVLVGASNQDSITINNEQVDVTNKTSQNAGGKMFRELLEKGGVQSVSISVDAVYTDTSTTKLIRDLALSNSHGTFRVEVPGNIGDGGGYYEGVFEVAATDLSGGHNTEVRQTYTLESAGEITFTSADIAFV